MKEYSQPKNGADMSKYSISGNQITAGQTGDKTQVIFFILKHTWARDENLTKTIFHVKRRRITGLHLLDLRL